LLRGPSQSGATKFVIARSSATISTIIPACNRVSAASLELVLRVYSPGLRAGVSRAPNRPGLIFTSFTTRGMRIRNDALFETLYALAPRRQIQTSASPRAGIDKGQIEEPKAAIQGTRSARSDHLQPGSSHDRRAGVSRRPPPESFHDHARAQSSGLPKAPTREQTSFRPETTELPRHR